ncbi:MAG TPA: hypothetical protein VGO34_14920 [Alphaproteobacteria bacterium]|jgi:hypothetical protein
MTIKLTSLKADVAAETEGQWQDVPDLPGVRFRVRSFNYGPYQAAKSMVEARWARKYGREPVPMNESLIENGKLYAKHILLEWDGLDQPYSPDLALQLFTDPAYRQMQEHLRYAASRVGLGEIEFADESAKNSGGLSGTTSAVEAQTPGSPS